jgi:hypothetical protein
MRNIFIGYYERTVSVNIGLVGVSLPSGAYARAPSIKHRHLALMSVVSCEIYAKSTTRGFATSREY